jgi:hypothetical protein
LYKGRVSFDSTVMMVHMRSDIHDVGTGCNSASGRTLKIRFCYSYIGLLRYCVGVGNSCSTILACN